MSNKGHAIAKLYKTQVSLTEWLDNIHHADTEKIRQEENDKLERLRAINTVIDFPIDDPVQFNPASELTADNPRLKELLATDGDRVCGIRLIPLDPKMPKIRTRGLTVRDSFEWFNQQKVDRTKYYTEFCSHTENAEWSSFFVVNEHGVSGEVIRDRMHHLSQGFYDDAKPIVFHFDFKKWQSEPHDDEAIAYMKSIVARLYVPDVTKQKLLAEKAGAKFVRDYLFGYYEITEAQAVFGLKLEDYSPGLGELYKDFVVRIDEPKESKESEALHGRGASTGIARGKVKIVQSPDDDFPKGGNVVLAAKVTTPDLVGLMKKSVAIITDQGGILSHAAIIARELGKPCVVDAANATTKLHDDDTVEVNGTTGEVKIISKARE